MKIYFLLTLINQTEAFAKSSPVVFPLAATDKGEIYLTFNDLQQLKILLLVMAVTGLFSLVKWFVSIFSKTEVENRKELKSELKQIREENKEIIDSLRELKIHFAHVKDSQVQADEIRAIARNEIEYVAKLRSKRE